MPPTREEMDELVRGHAGLDDRMEAAIWIRQDDEDAWLVELLPDIPKDQHPERPVHFNASRTFRHGLNLLAASLDDLQMAVARDARLADWIAHGEILHGKDAANELIMLARQAHPGHPRTG